MARIILDPYAARSCPVKTLNAFDPTLDEPPLDESLRESFQGGRDFRAEVLQHAAGQPGHVDVRGLEAPHERAAATVAALDSGAAVVIGALLPVDERGHRRGGADLLVRVGDGYAPVKVKNYRIVEKQLGCRDLSTSPLTAPGSREELPDLRFRAFRQGALLEVAHVWRMLDSLGRATEIPLAGIVGTEGAESAPRITWIRLDHRFLRTFSRTSPTGYKLRSALERYDHEHGFRVHVAEAALQRTGVDDPPAPVRPIRVKECEWCAWWQVCRTRMDDDDLSLRISKTPLDVRELQTLASLGIATVAELASADIEAILPDYLPLTTHREQSEQRLRKAAQRARMLAAGVPLEQVGTDRVGVPRSDVEVDLDIETAEGDRTYLWGVLVTDRRTGTQTYRSFASFRNLTGEQEIELAADFARHLADLLDSNPGSLVFHYSDYETVHLRRLADRSGHPDLVALCDRIDGCFVDLFTFVRDNFVAVDGLGLKVVASQGAGFRWRDEDPGGLNSQVWFATAAGDGAEPERGAARTRVLEYNEDDVRATWAVREWLEGLDRERRQAS